MHISESEVRGSRPSALTYYPCGATFNISHWPRRSKSILNRENVSCSLLWRYSVAHKPLISCLAIEEVYDLLPGTELLSIRYRLPGLRHFNSPVSCCYILTYCVSSQAAYFQVSKRYPCSLGFPFRVRSSRNLTPCFLEGTSSPSIGYFFSILCRTHQNRYFASSFIICILY